MRLPFLVIGVRFSNAGYLAILDRKSRADIRTTCRT